ncbi:MAG: helix-turn-helix transcriptional regulator [Terracidiphilus sp.]|jgi:DNA-binding CsgD family transcriptional regulator
MEMRFSNPEQSFGGTHQLLGLIEMIYATVQNPSLWPVVMERIGSAMEGESLALYASFPKSTAPTILALREMPQDVWDTFATYYAAINPIEKASRQRFSLDETWFSDRAITDGELKRTECYADFYRPNDMHYVAGMVIPLPNFLAAKLSCQRPKIKGPFNERADIVCQTLKPHLQCALSLHYQFGTLQAQSLGWRTALDAFDHAVFGLDAAGMVVLLNRHADAIASAPDGIKVVQGRLRAADPGCDRQMQKLIAGAVAAGTGRELSSGGSVHLQRRSENPPLRVTATPFRAPLVLGSPPIAALVFISDPERAPLSRSAVLRALYGLTAAEGRVADILLQGLEIPEAANRLGITLETGRLYVKRILAKTGASRQAELVRLMISLPGTA